MGKKRLIKNDQEYFESRLPPALKPFSKGIIIRQREIVLFNGSSETHEKYWNMIISLNVQQL
jgi:hypothetical protein